MEAGFAEDVEVEGFDVAGPIADAGSDEDVTGGEFGEEGFGFLGGLVGVHVVDDEKPAGVEPQPTKDGLDLKGLFLFILLREIQDERVAESGEVAMEGLGSVGGDEEEGAVVVGVFPGVFDGGAGLADAAHAVDGALAFDDDGAFGGEVLGGVRRGTHRGL